MGRQESIDRITERLGVRKDGGVRWITIDDQRDIARLFQDPRTGRWLFGWRYDDQSPFTEEDREFEAATADLAAERGIEEVAILLAMFEETNSESHLTRGIALLLPGMRPCSPVRREPRAL